MQKILVVGDANSLFIKQYIESVLIKNGYQVVLIKEGYVSDSRKQEYNELGVILEDRNVGLISKIPVIRTLFGARVWCKRMTKKYGTFSIVHVHGVNNFRGTVGNCMKKYCRKLVISIWGDEILRGSKKRKQSFAKFYNKAEVITTSTSHVYNQFVQEYGDKYKDKLTTCRFGLSIFDKIDEIEEKYTREEILKELGISNFSKITVLVGYNGREQQNLIPLTKTLQGLGDAQLNKIIAIYTFTYGIRSEEYDKELRKELDNLKCEKLFLTEYMNEVQTAKLRCVSDIMLHAQSTDAFSASIQECLYRGTIVFNGDWLIYNELNEIGAKLITFGDYEELQTILVDYLENYDDRKGAFVNNRRALRGLSSQEATEQAWLNAIR